MKEKRHISYSAFGKYFIDNRVGKKTTEEPVDAMLRLTHDEQVLSLLASIADVLQPIKPLLGVFDEVLQTHARKHFDSFEDFVRAEFVRRMEDLELRHGPCPSQDLRDILRRDYVASNLRGWKFSEYMRTDGRIICDWINPPHKSLPIRKDWDRWMRRKPPVKK